MRNVETFESFVAFGFPSQNLVFSTKRKGITEKCENGGLLCYLSWWTNFSSGWQFYSVVQFVVTPHFLTPAARRVQVNRSCPLTHVFPCSQNWHKRSNEKNPPHGFGDIVINQWMVEPEDAATYRCETTNGEYIDYTVEVHCEWGMLEKFTATLKVCLCVQISACHRQQDPLVAVEPRRPPLTNVSIATAFRQDHCKHFQKSKHLLGSEVS